MFITKNNKKNQWQISGYVSKTFIKQGQYGLFGMFVVAIDDGYYSKKEQKFIERTQFVAVDVGKLNDLPPLTVGDYIDLEGKFEIEQWEDKETGKPRTELKLKAMKLNAHIPAGICQVLKEQGYIKPPQQGAKAAQSGGAPHQQPPQPGRSQNTPSQQERLPQEPSPQYGGYNQQRGD